MKGVSKINESCACYNSLHWKSDKLDKIWEFGQLTSAEQGKKKDSWRNGVEWKERGPANSQCDLAVEVATNFRKRRNKRLACDLGSLTWALRQCNRATLPISLPAVVLSPDHLTPFIFSVNYNNLKCVVLKYFSTLTKNSKLSKTYYSLYDFYKKIFYF